MAKCRSIEVKAKTAEQLEKETSNWEFADNVVSLSAGGFVIVGAICVLSCFVGGFFWYGGAHTDTLRITVNMCLVLGVACLVCGLVMSGISSLVTKKHEEIQRAWRKARSHSNYISWWMR